MFEHQRPKLNYLFIMFVVLLVALLAACGGDDNASDNQYTIGIINFTPALDPIIDGFRSQIAELGYVEGENLTYIYDGPAESIDNLDSFAQKLVEADVDLILCLSTPAAQAVQRATVEKPIPSVFAPLQDPIGAGIVSSLSEPGGNLTGVMLGMVQGKRLEWLTRIAPNIERIYIPYNIDDPAPVAALESVSEVADQLSVELILQPARNAEEVTAAIENIPDDVDAIMILPDSIVAQSVNEFIAVAIEHKLPLLATSSMNVTDGALMSYNMETMPVGRQVARLADQILQGTAPADLPVEVAGAFLAINLQTAEIIDLEIPDSILELASIIIRDE